VSHRLDVDVQQRTPKHRLGRHHPQAAAGHGRLNLLLNPMLFGGITVHPQGALAGRRQYTRATASPLSGGQGGGIGANQAMAFPQRQPTLMILHVLDPRCVKGQKRGDSRSAWQRGSNENMNGLVCQNLPKGTDLSGYFHERLDVIADEIDNRPRKGLSLLFPIGGYAYRELLSNTSQDSTLNH
jgi:hypothetical protein